MQLLFTKESSAQFLNFAEGFVTECHRRGLSEKQASEALEASIPEFLLTHNENVRAGAEAFAKSAASPLGAAWRAGSKALAKGLPSHALGAAAGITAYTDNPVSQAMPDWMRDATIGSAGGHAIGRLVGGRLGAMAGTGAGALAGLGRNFVRHYTDLDGAGVSPSYADPTALYSGNRIDINQSSVGDKLRRHQGELQNLESQMSTLQGKMTNQSHGLNGSLEQQLAQREFNGLQSRHRDVTGQVSRAMNGLSTDQAAMRANGASRLATLNSSILAHRDKEAPLEKLLQTANGRGFGSLLASGWSSLTNAPERAAEIIGRRRALEAAQRLETNRSTANFDLGY
jgi:hypothetical protein